MRASSGSLSESSANAFDSYMTGVYQKYENLTGWLGETLNTVKQAHSNFMASRMWEFSNRINGKDGTFVGRFDIGYLSEVQYQQQATGFMRDYIMANPEMMELYQAERVSGYDGDFNQLCNGIGRDNYFYNRAMDGKVLFDEEQNTLNRTSFTSSRDTLTHLSFANRVDIHRTWQATNIHLAAGLFDPSSIINGTILTEEEVQAKANASAE
jgi:hypothetical protein